MVKNQTIQVLSRAIIISDGHILLAYHPRPEPANNKELSIPFYYLPGGQIEFKETAEAALQRELIKKTGHEIYIDHFLGVVEYSWNFDGDDDCRDVHEINLIFSANFAESLGKHEIPQKLENVAFKWIPLDQLQSIDLRPEDLKELIPEWIDM